MMNSLIKHMDCIMEIIQVLTINEGSPINNESINIFYFNKYTFNWLFICLIFYKDISYLYYILALQNLKFTKIAIFYTNFSINQKYWIFLFQKIVTESSASFYLIRFADIFTSCQKAIFIAFVYHRLLGLLILEGIY